MVPRRYLVTSTPSLVSSIVHTHHRQFSREFLPFFDETHIQSQMHAGIEHLQFAGGIPKDSQRMSYVTTALSRLIYTMRAVCHIPRFIHQRSSKYINRPWYYHAICSYNVLRASRKVGYLDLKAFVGVGFQSWWLLIVETHVLLAPS